MSTLKKLATIDQRTEYAVYGWIRHADQELMKGCLPTVISNICLLYFYEEEIFKVIGRAHI